MPRGNQHAAGKDGNAGDEGGETKPFGSRAPVGRGDGKRGVGAAAGDGDDDDEGEDDANQAFAHNQPRRKEGADAFGVFQARFAVLIAFADEVVGDGGEEGADDERRGNHRWQVDAHADGQRRYGHAAVCRFFHPEVK